MIVQSNARQELSEFYPPPYNFLGPQRRQKLHVLSGLNGTCPKAGCACGRGKRGMGQTGGQTTTSGLVSTTSGAAGGILGTTLPLVYGSVAAVPIAGQIAVAALAITAVIAALFKGCGQTCILTTNEVNQVEPYLQQNLAEYLAAPVSAATQQEALNNFNQLWQGVVTYCSQPSMSTAGKNCISDRQEGSCAYKTSPGGWNQTNGVWSYTYPGANGSGSTCWNWFVGYHDPIANDPRVAAASASSATTSNPVSAVASALSSGGLSSFLLPALLIGGGLLVMTMVDI
jgi:hypothetical protein